MVNGNYINTKIVIYQYLDTLYEYIFVRGILYYHSDNVIQQ